MNSYFILAFIVTPAVVAGLGWLTAFWRCGRRGSRTLRPSSGLRRTSVEVKLAESYDWGDPFVTFTEWATPEEEEAWKDL
jgi:hypothetical protein